MSSEIGTYMEKIDQNIDAARAQYILAGLLKSISNVADARRDLGSLLVEFASMAHRLVPSDRCTVWVHDKEKKVLWTSLAEGVDKIEVAENSGVVGSAYQSGQPLIINAPYEDSRFNQEIDKITGYRTENIIAIPLVTSNREIVGVFQALNKLDVHDSNAGEGLDCEGYTSSDLTMLQFVTVYIAREIDATLLRDELEETQREIIYTLAETGEMRSKETGNHVKRVAEYTKFMGRAIGLPEREVEVIGIASTLHDVGKIAIPDSVLLKNGRLTPEEFRVIMTHSQLGYDMLRHSNRVILKAAATIAYEHHEKWNGSGYPNGLAGDDIHIYGRIVAVADVYDALACKRCYKEPWEHEKIVSLFREERGKHFDPQMADIFLENQDVFIDIKETYKDE